MRQLTSSRRKRRSNVTEIYDPSDYQKPRHKRPIIRSIRAALQSRETSVNSGSAVVETTRSDRGRDPSYGAPTRATTTDEPARSIRSPPGTNQPIATEEEANDWTWDSDIDVELDVIPGFGEGRPASPERHEPTAWREDDRLETYPPAESTTHIETPRKGDDSVPPATPRDTPEHHTVRQSPVPLTSVASPPPSPPPHCRGSPCSTPRSSPPTRRECRDCDAGGCSTPAGPVAQANTGMGEIPQVVREVSRSAVIIISSPAHEPWMRANLGIPEWTARYQTPDLSRVLGMRACRSLLDRIIGTRMANPDMFSGKRSTEPYLCLYGQEGSGKKTLLHAYCRQHGINVIQLAPYYTSCDWIDRVMQAALALEPCVIHFDDCGSHFTPEATARSPTAWPGQLAHFSRFNPGYSHCVDGGSGGWAGCGSASNRVWFAWTGPEVPSEAFLADTARLLLGRSEYARPPGIRDRMRFLRRVCDELWPPPSSSDVVALYTPSVVPRSRDRARSPPGEGSGNLRHREHDGLPGGGDVRNGYHYHLGNNREDDRGYVIGGAGDDDYDDDDDDRESGGCEDDDDDEHASGEGLWHTNTPHINFLEACCSDELSALTTYGELQAFLKRVFDAHRFAMFRGSMTTDDGSTFRSLLPEMPSAVPDPRLLAHILAKVNQARGITSRSKEAHHEYYSRLSAAARAASLVHPMVHETPLRPPTHDLNPVFRHAQHIHTNGRGGR